MIIKDNLAVSSKDIVAVWINMNRVHINLRSMEGEFYADCDTSEEAKSLFDKIVNQMEY